METITLADLAPIIAAVLGPMLVFAVAIMRYQHVDSTKTRDLIDRNYRELSGSVSDIQGRLGRIEGHMGIPATSEAVNDEDAEAA